MHVNETLGKKIDSLFEESTSLFEESTSSKARPYLICDKKFEGVGHFECGRFKFDEISKNNF